MAGYNKRKPTWIGNANSIVEKGKDNYLFKDGNCDGIRNSFSLERFGDRCLEGLDIPAWLEESITIGSSPATNSHNNLTNTTKVDFSSPRVVPYTANEHNYAITPPPEKEKQHFVQQNNYYQQDDNILPIIDDLLGNSQTYNLDQFMDESPLSSPGGMLPPAHEEYDFQNINELLNQHTTTDQASNIVAPAAVNTALFNMISATSVPTTSSGIINNNAFTSIITQLHSIEIPEDPQTTNGLATENSDILMVASPSTDSGMFSGHSSINSPASVYVAASPESSYMHQLMNDDDSSGQSSINSSPRSSMYDGLAVGSNNSKERSTLVQLLLGDLNDDSFASDSQIDFKVLDDSLSNSSGTSICDDDELNRILDGDYLNSLLPRSDSSSSDLSSVGSTTIVQPLNSNSLNVNSHEQNLSSQEAIVPSTPNVEPSKASSRKRKSTSAPKTTSVKNQKCFTPFTVEMIPTSNNVDSNSPTIKPPHEFVEPAYQGKPKGRKIYKTKEAKERKMSQNRTAAIRYRHKKKDELSDMEKEADGLEEKNGKLRTKVDDMRREIDYLKNLMLDVIKAKLSVNSDQEREETMKLLDELTESELPKRHAVIGSC